MPVIKPTQIDGIRVIHKNSTKGQADVGMTLNNKWGTRVTNKNQVKFSKAYIHGCD